MDSTPVKCGPSRDTAKRSDLARRAQYGYCRSHSRWLWELRLHLVATPSGLPIAFALAGAKADERDTCAELIDHAGIARAGQTIIADKSYRKAGFAAQLNQAGIPLIGPALRSEPQRPSQQLLLPRRQTIESTNSTLTAHLSLERHRGRTRPGVSAPILTRILALTAAIWHNQTTHRPGPTRSIIAHDH